MPSHYKRLVDLEGYGSKGSQITGNYLAVLDTSVGKIRRTISVTKSFPSGSPNGFVATARRKRKTPEGCMINRQSIPKEHEINWRKTKREKKSKNKTSQKEHKLKNDRIIPSRTPQHDERYLLTPVCKQSFDIFGNCTTKS